MTGNEVARQLLATGYTILAFDNFFASSKISIQDLAEHPAFHFFEYDLNNAEQMKSLLRWIEEKRTSFDELSFIHCAAVVHTKHFYQPSETFQTNVIGTKAFLDMAVVLKADKFINCSTSEVYSLGSFAEGGVKESDPLSLATAEISQRTSYAVGKLNTEFFMKEACEKKILKGCSIRFANVYSSDELLPEHIIPYTIQNLRKNARITLLENAKKTKRTFLHNIDSCRAVISLLEKDEALDGSIYNVGTMEEIAIVDLVKKIADSMHVKNLEIVFSGTRTADPERRLLSIEKIRRRTGWSPVVSLDEGVKKCIEYAQKNKAAS